MIRNIWKIMLFVGVMTNITNAEVVQLRKSYDEEFRALSLELLRSGIKGNYLSGFSSSNVICDYLYDVDAKKYSTQTIQCTYADGKSAVKMQIIHDTLFDNPISQFNLLYYYPNGKLLYKGSFIIAVKKGSIYPSIYPINTHKGYNENGKLQQEEEYKIEIVDEYYDYKNVVFVSLSSYKTYYENGNLKVELIVRPKGDDSMSVDIKYFNNDGTLNNFEKDTRELAVRDYFAYESER